MPEPKAEIKKLSTEAPGKIAAEEVRQTWLEENPGKNPVDFDQFKTQQEFKSWEASTLESIQNADVYSQNAVVEIPTLQKMDDKLLRLSKPEDIKFEKQSAKDTYGTLLARFNDSQFSMNSSSPTWPIRDDARGNWADLVAKAKAQVQRNATDLASVVSTSITLATEDIKNSNPKDPNAVTSWQQTKLYDRLTKLETALKSWDNLLDSYLSSDRATLQDLAKKCADRFADFATEHASRYKTYTGADGEPLYVKYQLLATAKALAEKVASQFAARSTTSPSFAAMYDRIIDVPLTGTLKAARQTASDLATNYAKGANPKLDKAWTTELSKLRQQLKAADRTVVTKLDAAFKELNQKSITVPDPIDPTGPIVNIKKSTVEENLADWSDEYESFGKLDSTLLMSLQLSTNSVALDLGKHKQAVDRVLAAPELSNIRSAYQDFFDGMTMKIQSSILRCQEFS
jgi:hypothetical protein